jgi:hypothetical protein
MGKTIVDFPKVAQMLDAGWSVTLFKNQLYSYTATAFHPKHAIVKAAQEKLLALAPPEMRGVVAEGFESNAIDTDDFTPEQALTRLAYKVHGEVI